VSGTLPSSSTSNSARPRLTRSGSSSAISADRAPFSHSQWLRGLDPGSPSSPSEPMLRSDDGGRRVVVVSQHVIALHSPMQLHVLLRLAGEPCICACRRLKT
jgi:hypothetical protein